MPLFLMMFLWLIVPPSVLAVADIPDHYEGLKFGADTLAVKKAFPGTEMQRFTVDRKPPQAARGVVCYTVVFKKGLVDSARLYFVDNRFAMALAFCYPGRDFQEKALNSLTGRYGQFVGQGTTYWRRNGEYVIRTGWINSLSIATISYLNEPLTEKLSKRLADSPSPEEQAIDKELKTLGDELKQLDKKKK